MKFAILLCCLALSACAPSARDREIANSAATIYEAQTAQEQGTPTDKAGPVIKANAMSIIHATGHLYNPGEKK